MANINLLNFFNPEWTSNLLANGGSIQLPGVYVDPRSMVEELHYVALPLTSPYADLVGIDYTRTGDTLVIHNLVYAKYTGPNATTTVLSFANLNATVSIHDLSGSTWSIPVTASSDVIYGNSTDDVISGGSGNDVLWGATGNDILKGGSGDDTLRGDQGNDDLIGGEGIDTVDYSAYLRSSFTFVKDIHGVVAVRDIGRAGTQFDQGTDLLSGVEFMRFADGMVDVSALPFTYYGTSGKDTYVGTVYVDDINGGGGFDIIIAGGGNDLIRGGLGKDTLTGGKDKDAFIFDTKPSKTNVDKITDFNPKDDSIWLDNAVFTKLGSKGSISSPAKLNKAFFTLGTEAKDKNDYVIYDNKKGVLYYDADGSGNGKAVEVASFSNKAKLTVSDFFVI
jgi:Ca2+-binding RTX toxin-like protein